MNTDAYYEPHLPYPAPGTPDQVMTEAELSALAHHRDPSLADNSDGPPRSGRDRSIAWVRPSELVTTGLTPLLERGAEHQAELVRQARRTPSTVTRAGRRITRSAIARPEQSSPTQEGLGL